MGASKINGLAIYQLAKRMAKTFPSQLTFSFAGTNITWIRLGILTSKVIQYWSVCEALAGCGSEDARPRPPSFGNSQVGQIPLEFKASA